MNYLNQFRKRSNEKIKNIDKIFDSIIDKIKKIQQYKRKFNYNTANSVIIWLSVANQKFKVQLIII
ncbi:hypothetical protein [Orientia tsutsugamushi]|uniref:hypothetical protein n=1 Tax=Orientia tsutsugamushi TaxID=784 RepID=UPI0002FC6C02|nr:hypothetical protein [Orientia tsutsugamushi]